MSAIRRGPLERVLLLPPRVSGQAAPGGAEPPAPGDGVPGWSNEDDGTARVSAHRVFRCGSSLPARLRPSPREQAEQWRFLEVRTFFRPVACSPPDRACRASCRVRPAACFLCGNRLGRASPCVPCRAPSDGRSSARRGEYWSAGNRNVQRLLASAVVTVICRRAFRPAVPNNSGAVAVCARARKPGGPIKSVMARWVRAWVDTISRHGLFSSRGLRTPALIFNPTAKQRVPTGPAARRCAGLTAVPRPPGIAVSGPATSPPSPCVSKASNPGDSRVCRRSAATRAAGPHRCGACGHVPPSLESPSAWWFPDSPANFPATIPPSFPSHLSSSSPSLVLSACLYASHYTALPLWRKPLPAASAESDPGPTTSIRPGQQNVNRPAPRLRAGSAGVTAPAVTE